MRRGVGADVRDTGQLGAAVDRTPSKFGHAGTLLANAGTYNPSPLVAMAGGDVSSAALGVTDPTTWGANAWLSDLVPHLAYGLATAATYEALAEGRSGRRF